MQQQIEGGILHCFLALKTNAFNYDIFEEYINVCLVKVDIQ